MNHFRDRRGQAMIEFAIIIPLFVLLIHSFAYLGMLVHDYLTLNELTRVIARDVSVRNGQYDSTKYGSTAFLTDMYRWNSQSGVTITPPTPTPGESFKVTLTATRNVADSSDWAIALPTSISTSLIMRREE